MSRKWLITGASRGFGRHLAEAVLEFGDDLVATARRPEQLDDLVARATASGYGQSRWTSPTPLEPPAR
jgi:NAD(P)-dependent dehydrogenase (short-subunit alcohol dehydrogenase family)